LHNSTYVLHQMQLQDTQKLMAGIKSSAVAGVDAQFFQLTDILCPTDTTTFCPAGFDFNSEVLKLKCIRQSDPAAWKAMVRYFPARCRAAVDAEADASVRSGALKPPAAALHSSR
jgi:hypothetical protein